MEAEKIMSLIHKTEGHFVLVFWTSTCIFQVRVEMIIKFLRNLLSGEVPIGLLHVPILGRS